MVIWYWWGRFLFGRRDDFLLSVYRSRLNLNPCSIFLFKYQVTFLFFSQWHDVVGQEGFCQTVSTVSYDFSDLIVTNFNLHTIQFCSSQTFFIICSRRTFLLTLLTYSWFLGRLSFNLNVLSNGWWTHGIFLGTSKVLFFGTSLIFWVSTVPLGVFG